MLQFSFYPSPTRIPMACSKVDKDPEDPEDLEGLRHLTFKESAGTREVKTLYQVMPVVHILIL
jgi:hypothetical protein